MAKAATWAAIILTPTIIIPIVIVKTGDEQKRRPFAALVTIFSFASLSLLTFISESPLPVRILCYGGLITMVAGSIFNLFTRTSGHAICSAYSATVALSIQPIFGLLMIVATLLVGWSRLRLNQHTLAQVESGMIAGFLPLLIVWAALF